MRRTQFDDFFRAATTHKPFEYQRRLAEDHGPGIAKSMLINLPTGLGKTAAVVMAWLRNLVEKRSCPRRLVYCLPMRTLVEQTRDNVAYWLRNLSKAYSNPEILWLAEHSPVVLMGGEDNRREAAEWDLWPEKPCIMIGTQDMLLSRALNRGYAAGRARWPKDFALLNNDCLWVFDEVQLMGSGFATSLQLQAWREELRLRDPASGFRMPRAIVSRTHSWWMSATLDRDWLQHGVDYRKRLPDLWAACEEESRRFWSEDAGQDLRVKVLLSQNRKSLQQVAASKKGKTFAGLALRKGADDEYLRVFAAAIAQTREAIPGQLVLVIVNTVARAIKLAEKFTADKPVLLHSRFRARERKEQIEGLKGAGFVIATQVVEAGVDISAKVLFTEICPWPSFIQRLGRCARGFGTDDHPEPQKAEVFWTNVSAVPTPYTEEEIGGALDEIGELKEANLGALKAHADRSTSAKRRSLLPYEPRFVPRDKDLFDLFDTTPDLTGADIDIARFIRDTDDLDVFVFWRDCSALNGKSKPPKSWRPQHAELCPVPCRASDGNFKDFARKVLHGRNGRIWRWDYKNGWLPLAISELDRVYPGQIFLLESTCGGYKTYLGWTGETEDQPWIADRRLLGPWGAREVEDPDDSDESDTLSETGVNGEWQDIFSHTREVCEELRALLEDSGISSSIPENIQHVLRMAARLHDWGKVHPAFQAKLKPAAEGCEQSQMHYPVAKAPDYCWRRGRLPRKPQDELDKRRAGFRHELASALAVLELLRTGNPCHEAVTWPGAELREHFVVESPSSGVQLPAQTFSLFNELSELTPAEFDLLLYTVAAHHGKVRMSLRTAPDDTREDVPDPCPADKQQARGVRNGEQIPVVNLPGPDSDCALAMPEITLYLDPMELGLGVRYGRSWRERTQSLLETHGPFQLAWLEALLRVADGRASRRAENRSR